MADRDGIVCIKRTLFIGNLILWFIGIGVLVFAMWLFFDTGNTDAPEKLDEHLRYVSKDLSYYYAAVYLLMGAGLIILCTGFFGWLGAHRESPCMLITYSVIISIIFTSHLTAAAIGYAYRKEVQVGVSTGIKKVVLEQYGNLPVYDRETQIIDYIQGRFNCCGGVEYEEWSSSNWKNSPKYQDDDIVPASCCFGSSGIDVICPTYSSVIGGKNPYMHQTGCGTKLKMRFSQYIVGITAGGFTVGLLEIVALGLSVTLVLKIRKEDKKIY